MWGGGIFRLVHYSGQTFPGNLAIINNTISGNRAEPELPYGYDSQFVPLGGGGVAVYGYESELVISGNSITENYSSGFGGGILAQSLEDDEISNNEIHDNEVVTNVSNEDVETFGSCSCYYPGSPQPSGDDYPARWRVARGGGLFLTESVGLLVVGNRVSGNVASSDGVATGGGISVRPLDSDIRIAGNVLGGNAADDEGGGIHIDQWSDFPPFKRRERMREDDYTEVINNTASSGFLVAGFADGWVG